MSSRFVREVDGGGIQRAEKGPNVGFQQRSSLLSSSEASERKLRNLAWDAWDITCFSGSSPRMEAGLRRTQSSVAWPWWLEM